VKYLTLRHSGLTIGVSSRVYLMFPEHRGRYPVLPVDMPLTFERWAAAGFDPNAEVILALGSG
jgi:hypothetical protein